MDGGRDGLLYNINYFLLKSLPRLKFNTNILLTCIPEVLFYDHRGNIYIQKDGVAMGAVLGMIFSNFYISDLEKNLIALKKSLNIA